MMTISQQPPAPDADPVAVLRKIWAQIADADKIRLARLSHARDYAINRVFARDGSLLSAPDTTAAQQIVHLARAAQIA